MFYRTHMVCILFSCNYCCIDGRWENREQFSCVLFLLLWCLTFTSKPPEEYRASSSITCKSRTGTKQKLLAQRIDFWQCQFETVPPPPLNRVRRNARHSSRLPLFDGDNLMISCRGVNLMIWPRGCRRWRLLLTPDLLFPRQCTTEVVGSFYEAQFSIIKNGGRRLLCQNINFSSNSGTEVWT